MEATIANCLEPGETIVVATSGIWGQRVCDLSERYGGNTHCSYHMKRNVGLAYLHGSASLPAGCASEVTLRLSPVQADLMTHTAVHALHLGLPGRG